MCIEVFILFSHGCLYFCGISGDIPLIISVNINESLSYLKRNYTGYNELSHKGFAVAYIQSVIKEVRNNQHDRLEGFRKKILKDIDPNALPKDQFCALFGPKLHVQTRALLGWAQYHRKSGQPNFLSPKWNEFFFSDMFEWCCKKDKAFQTSLLSGQTADSFRTECAYDTGKARDYAVLLSPSVMTKSIQKELRVQIETPQPTASSTPVETTEGRFEVTSFAHNFCRKKTSS
eukprot:TRINITY_DN20268_c0_g1_i1.p1 TRINITY_DN20268_c0_g1~~TRINITY_DN20268_c0_g1_i1.p1  ORF type:complete len:232 (+),score=15.91 TRINITY_DN20268_c0_g1_i1:44-739(+)